jgi:hypothetical protein
MEEYHFGASLSNSRSVCVGPITRDEAAAAGAEFCDGLGYYLYVTDAENPQGTEVLARFASEEAAFRMSAVLRRLCSA